MLTRDNLDVVRNWKVILRGKRNEQDKLWDIPIPQAQDNPRPRVMGASGVQAPIQEYRTSTKTINDVGTKVRRTLECDETGGPTTWVNIFKGGHKAAVIIRKRQPHVDLVKYHHATCFSPVKSTTNI